MRWFLRCLVVFLVISASASVWADEVVQPLSIGMTYSLDSKALGERRRVNVYAPPGFDGADAPTLPVLYVLDGGIKEDFLHVAGLVQVSSGNGTMRPFLVVGIENTDRRRDFTGPTVNPEDKKIAPRVGGSAKFRAFLRDELMPDVRGRFKTTSEAAIIGESLAGLFIVETMTEAPEMFATYVAIDPSLWWNNEALAAGAPAWAKAHRQAKATLFIASSKDGNGQSVANFVKSLSGSGVRVLYEPMTEETHATIFHPAALRAVRAVFKPAP